MEVLGSSPLTRGKPKPCRSCQATGGLIPAHAGKTSRYLLLPIPRRAHPRSRGENSWKLKGKAIVSGSSPLTRGKRDVSLDDVQGPGLIPAHAGKTGVA